MSLLALIWLAIIVYHVVKHVAHDKNKRRCFRSGIHRSDALVNLFCFAIERYASRSILILSPYVRLSFLFSNVKHLKSYNGEVLRLRDFKHKQIVCKHFDLCTLCLSNMVDPLHSLAISPVTQLKKELKLGVSLKHICC